MFAATSVRRPKSFPVPEYSPPLTSGRPLPDRRLKSLSPPIASPFLPLSILSAKRGDETGFTCEKEPRALPAEVAVGGGER